MENPIKSRVEYLILLCEDVLKTETSTQYENETVDNRIFNKYRAASLSFLKQYFGEDHPYYESFYAKDSTYAPIVRSSLGVLEAVLDEVNEGWYRSIRGVVSAEVFSDFIEMSTYLLDEGYKDAAAVMLGSTLEEHLRQLARENGIDVEIEKNGKYSPKKADLLNSDLTKNEVYGKLDQKNVTAWLDLRNKSAHGKYDEYSIEQVLLFSQALTDFMVRTKE